MMLAARRSCCAAAAAAAPSSSLAPAAAGRRRRCCCCWSLARAPARRRRRCCSSSAVLALLFVVVVAMPAAPGPRRTATLSLLPLRPHLHLAGPVKTGAPPGSPRPRTASPLSPVASARRPPEPLAAACRLGGRNRRRVLSLSRSAVCERHRPREQCAGPSQMRWRAPLVVACPHPPPLPHPEAPPPGQPRQPRPHQQPQAAPAASLRASSPALLGALRVSPERAALRGSCGFRRHQTEDPLGEHFREPELTVQRLMWN